MNTKQPENVRLQQKKLCPLSCCPNLSVLSYCRTFNYAGILSCSGSKLYCKSSPSVLDSQKGSQDIPSVSFVKTSDNLPLDVKQQITSNTLTPQDILELVQPSLLSKAVDHEDISLIFKSLKGAMIKEIYKLHSSEVTTSIDAYIKHAQYENMEIFQPYQTNASFQLLKTCASEHVEEMSSSELVSCWSALYYFNTQTDEPLYTALWMKLDDSERRFTAQEIVDVQRPLEQMSLMALVRWSGLHFQKLMLEDRLEKDEKELVCAMKVASLSAFSHDFLQNFLTSIVSIISDNRQNYSFSVYLGALDIVQGGYKYSQLFCRRTFDIENTLFSLVTDFCNNNLNQLKGFELAVLLRKALNLGHFPWAKLVSKRAFQIFPEEPKSLSDFLRLVHLLPINSLLKEVGVARIMQVLNSKADQFDSFMVPHLVAIILRLNIDRNLVTTSGFHKKIISLIIENFGFQVWKPKVYSNVFHYVQKYSDNTLAAFDKLEAQVPPFLATNTEYICFRLYFLMMKPLSSEQLADILVMISNCSIPDLELVLRGISVAFIDSPGKNRRIQKKIQLTHITAAVTAKIRLDKVSWRKGINMILSVLRSARKQVHFIQGVYGLMPLTIELSKVMSAKEFFKICRVATVYGFSDWTLLNNMISFVLKTEIGFFPLLRLLPQVCDSLPPEITKALIALFEKKHIRQSLSLDSEILVLDSFCSLQIFPTEALMELFTLKTLTEVDKLVLEGGNNNMIGNLISINQAVVLECPQLEIPWLFDNFDISSQWSKGPEHSYTRAKNDFTSKLNVAFGEDNIGENILTEKFNLIDFLVLVDKRSGKPVRFSMESFKNAEKLGFDKIAFVLIYQNNVLMDSIEIRGKVRSNIRQLDILGYKTLPIYVRFIQHFNSTILRKLLQSRSVPFRGLYSPTEVRRSRDRKE